MAAPGAAPLCPRGPFRGGAEVGEGTRSRSCERLSSRSRFQGSDGPSLAPFHGQNVALERSSAPYSCVGKVR